MNAKQSSSSWWQCYSALIGFAAVAVPFVAYSIYRTGYELLHLIELRALTLSSVVLIAISVAMLVIAQRLWQPILAGFAGAFVAVAFAACHIALVSPFDYKLWIYVVAPRFLFATFIAFISMALLRRVFPNAQNA